MFQVQSLLLGRELCGGRILRSCLQKAPATAHSNYDTPPPHPKFAQPGLSRSNGNHHQREGTNLGVSVAIWPVLPRREATNLGVFDLLCHSDHLKRGCANSQGRGGGLELA